MKVVRVVADRFLLGLFFLPILLVSLASAQDGAGSTSRSRSGLRSNIVGEVRDAQGNPIKDAEVIAQDLDGKALARATTNDKGQYSIRCLEQRKYLMALNALPVNFQGQSAVAFLGEKGLIINWTTAVLAPTIVTAKQGGGICGAAWFSGLNQTETLITSVAAVGSTVSLGLALGGVLEDPPSHPASPSQ
jgi:Carboxypeptidase regulatory-like domain